jgi:hypothetical protein
MNAITATVTEVLNVNANGALRKDAVVALNIVAHNAVPKER